LGKLYMKMELLLRKEKLGSPKLVLIILDYPSMIQMINSSNWKIRGLGKIQEKKKEEILYLLLTRKTSVPFRTNECKSFIAIYESIWFY